MVEAAFGITITEVTWRKPSDFFKCVGKVMRISIANVIANLGNGVVGFAKFGLGVFHLGLQDKLLNGNLRPFFEIGGQVFFVVTEVVCNIGDLQVTTNIQCNVISDIVVELTTVIGIVVTLATKTLGAQFGQNNRSVKIIQALDAVATFRIL